MAQLLLLIAAGLGAWYGWRYWKQIQRLPAELRSKMVWRAALITLALALLALAAAGRAPWLAAGLAATFAFAYNLSLSALRILPLLRVAGRVSGARIGPTLTTAWLQIKINLADGTLDGEVVQGEFAGRPLAGLSRDQLQRLFVQLQGLDRQSALLLGAYLARRFGPAGAHGDGPRDGDPRQAPGVLSGAEAAQILGVASDATRDEIVQAHRRLIQKLHPDRGGSDYLAARVNAAKDHLLKTRA